MSDFQAKMHQIQFRLGLCLRPCWGSSQRSPDFPAGFKGPSCKKRGAKRGRNPLYFLRIYVHEREYVTFGFLLSQIRLSSVCLSVCLSVCKPMHPTQGLKLSAIFLHRCVPGLSSDYRAKFYADRPSDRGR